MQFRYCRNSDDLHVLYHKWSFSLTQEDDFSILPREKKDLVNKGYNNDKNQ